MHAPFIDPAKHRACAYVADDGGLIHRDHFYFGATTAAPARDFAGKAHQSKAISGEGDFSSFSLDGFHRHIRIHVDISCDILAVGFQLWPRSFLLALLRLDNFRSSWL
jgi:hypothetical protein